MITTLIKRWVLNRKYYWDSFESVYGKVKSDNEYLVHYEWIKATGYGRKTGERLIVYASGNHTYNYAYPWEIINDGKLIIKWFNKLKILDLDNSIKTQAWLESVREQWVQIDKAMDEIK